MDDTPDILDGLEERLQSHAKAFESLLALTPAREYYGSQIADGQDPSEQWNRKKQTKEQKKAAKKAKLDPANQKSALDVMKERERKRKRELGMEDDDGEQKEEGVAVPDKRQKVELDEDAAAAKRRARAEKRKDKRLEKKEKIARKKAKVDAKKAAKQDKDLDEAQAEQQQGEKTVNGDRNPSDDEPENTDVDTDLGAFDASGLADESVPHTNGDADDHASHVSSAPSSPVADSPPFDTATNNSTTSSSSSIAPPSGAEQPQPKHKKQAPPAPAVDTTAAASVPLEAPTKRRDPPSGTSSPKLQLPNIDQEQLQERLRQRIEELRAKRKADGPDGKPAKSRQELLDQRRKKEEQRKAANKERRRKEKDEEERKREEHLRGSGSPLSADIFSPSSPRPHQDTNFSFSRLAFEDGTAADAALTGLTDPRKKKGPQDPRTALEAAQNKQARLAALDPEKRADIAEKDLWLNAKKRANGEKVRDDTSLLKKALKRKEKAKGKSETQWKEREATVVKGKEMKQKKRETNLAKRRDEKGGGSKKGKKSGPPKGGKKGGRPGFEGRFKA
ncbi:hypothetical protein LTR08_000694 [Meristemomyces frigidus]|nr:hypothetical protein LTR08_000694 [Meristemomyces frigidus]